MKRLKREKLAGRVKALPSKVKKRHLLDYSILIPYVILCMVGLIMVYSSTSYIQLEYDENPMGQAITQALFWGISLIAITLIYKMKTAVFQKRYFIMFVIAVIGVLLLLVRFTSLGAVRNGARGWLILFGFSIQPAEYLKIMVVWYLSFILSRRQSYIAEDFKRAALRPLLLVGALILLVAIQPDVGNATILTLITMIMIMASGINYMYTYLFVGSGFLVSFGLIELMLVTGGNILPARLQYIYDRFEIFRDPFQDVWDKGHQMANSYYAISNGGWFGLGLGNSIQKKGYLPEAHTDFIFSIVVEELGLLAALIILGILLFMIARIILVGVRSNNPFNSLMCIGIGGMFLIQVFINLGGITGVIPLTGITFPFLSQGGSSLLVLSIAIGFVLNISADEKRRRLESEFEVLVVS